jgi:uncharacterized membrane protein YedE/YeeE
MEPLSVVQPLLGGVLIGIASVLVLKAYGRVAGVSGIAGGLLKPVAGDIAWRVAFVAGLLIAGTVAAFVAPQSLRIEDASGTLGVVGVVATGLLVGFGTRLGNGCTSGHGVCGVSRLSTRSIVATLTFMFTGGVTVYVVRHLFDSATQASLLLQGAN